MSRSCINCAAPVNTLRADAKFCSPACRVSHHRAERHSKAVPAELATVPRWVRWKPSGGRKRPLMVNGAPASVADSSTWADYASAAASKAGVGLGFVLSGEDDIACIDIDDCVVDGVVSPAALEVIEATPDKFMVEYSISRKGIHVWHHSGNEPGTNRVENGVRVERYHQARYIAVTGNRVNL